MDTGRCLWAKEKISEVRFSRPKLDFADAIGALNSNWNAASASRRSGVVLDEARPLFVAMVFSGWHCLLPPLIQAARGWTSLPSMTSGRRRFV